jgi:hypothetical protein
VTRETIYFVQAFNAGRGGNLKADTPVACKTETSAPETGDYDDEPTVFFRQGQFPSAFD